MKREIKYRGLSLEHGKWIYGFPLKHGHVDDWYIVFNYTDEILDKFRIYDDTRGEFTGVKDRVGVEIYEGDIISVDCGDKIIPVTFENGCFVTIWKGSKYRLGGWKTKSIIVIGNIYEHPHLLAQSDPSNGAIATEPQ